MNPLTEIQALSLPDERSLSSGATAALKMAQTFAITDDDDYAMAGDELKAIKSKQKALEDRRTSITGPLNKAVKAVNDLFRGPMEALGQAEAMFKRSMIAYSDAKQRKADEERRIAEAAMRAEQERLAKEAAEKERAAREEAEALARQAEQARAAGDEQAAEAAAAQAAQLQQQAAAEAQSLQMAAKVMMIPAATAAPKAAGVSKVSVTYMAEVTDKLAFLKFCAERPDMLAMIDINATKLNALARAQGTLMNYPGVRVVERKSISARAAA